MSTLKYLVKVAIVVILVLYSLYFGTKLILKSMGEVKECYTKVRFEKAEYIGTKDIKMRSRRNRNSKTRIVKFKLVDSGEIVEMESNYKYGNYSGEPLIILGMVEYFDVETDKKINTKYYLSEDEDVFFNYINNGIKDELYFYNYETKETIKPNILNGYEQLRENEYLNKSLCTINVKYNSGGPKEIEVSNFIQSDKQEATFIVNDIEYSYRKIHSYESDIGTVYVVAEEYVPKEASEKVTNYQAIVKYGDSVEQEIRFEIWDVYIDIDEKEKMIVYIFEDAIPEK